MADLNSTIVRGNLRVTEEIIGPLNIANLSTGANGQFLSISNNVPTWVNNPNTWRPLGTGANDAAAGDHSHDNRYLSLGGGTLTGALNFNNSTWNLVGDDVYIGDYDQAGSLGIKGKNGQTNIGFVNQSNNYYIKLASPGVTANRTITMPNDDGTIALTKNIPTSLPANDVYAWAKAATKPTYNWSEITQSGANNIEEGASDVTDNTELFTSYASNNGFADSAATGKVYRRDAVKIYNYVKGKLDSVYLPLTGGTVTGELIMSANRLWIQGGSAAGSNSNRLTTSSGMPGDMQYNNGKRGLQLYSNGIALADPYNGNANNDSAWIRHLETTVNTGLLEIAAGDDAGNEEIRFRYYDTSNNIAHDILVPKKTGTIALTSDIPTSLPASDVYAWAKASTKPSYTKSEVGLGNVDNTADANKSVNYATSSHLLRSYSASNSSHGEDYYLKCRHNVDGNDRFKLQIIRSDGSVTHSTSVDYANSAGSVAWGNVTGKPSTFTPSGHSHSTATQSGDGFMSSTDKKKLDGIAEGANKTIVDSSLSSSSTNPVQNTVINSAIENIRNSISGLGSALNNKANSGHSHPVDSSLSSTSGNPVKNSAIYSAFSNAAGFDYDYYSYGEMGSWRLLQYHATGNTLDIRHGVLTINAQEKTYSITFANPFNSNTYAIVCGIYRDNRNSWFWSPLITKRTNKGFSVYVRGNTSSDNSGTLFYIAIRSN